MFEASRFELLRLLLSRPMPVRITPYSNPRGKQGKQLPEGWSSEPFKGSVMGRRWVATGLTGIEEEASRESVRQQGWQVD